MGEGMSMPRALRRILCVRAIKWDHELRMSNKWTGFFKVGYLSQK